jgi:alpha-galactosidase
MRISVSCGSTPRPPCLPHPASRWSRIARFWGRAIALGAVFLALFLAEVRATSVRPDEMSDMQRWVAAHFAPAEQGVRADLPFTFRYGGKPSAALLGDWARTHESHPLDATRIQHTLTCTDKATGLEVRCVGVEYRDFAVVEWTVYFRNTGRVATPILEDEQALDVSWQRSEGPEFLLHHAAGSQANKSDYGPRETPLPPGSSHRFGGAGGRPTNVDWSYFNLQWGDEGLIVVVGWPGQWEGTFTRDTAHGVRVRAGQEKVHTKLLPGEEIRTPLMVVQFWRGDFARAQNLWRRWMMAHSMPKPGGKLPPPQFVASSSRAYEEMIKATESNQIMHIDRYLEEGLKLDYWWMDAGWYIQEQGWPQVGTWEVDPRRFPHGFRPISDHAHAKGVKILVWFEPERVMPGTWLYKHHPEWLLQAAETHTLSGMRSWSASAMDGSDPCVSYNPTAKPRSTAGIVWDPGRLSFHPGPKGEYSVVRWTAPEAGDHEMHAAFLGIDKSTTTDVHLLHQGHPLFDGQINLAGKGRETSYDGRVAVAKGDTLDLVVGWGNGTHVCDSTGLDVRIKSPSGKTFDAAHDFSEEANPGGPWSYGYLKPGRTPDVSTFQRYDRPGKPGEDGMRLLDLGNPAARQWLTDHVDRLLTEQGIDLYRQDFNMDPLAFWRAADASDRQGITENKHVCGYLAYWDELRRRHPAMLIDSCASGGRRNDLETMRRAVPLWRSDYAYESIGHQCMTQGISLWLPYHGTGTVASTAAPYYGGGLTTVEPYAFWSNTAPSLGCGVDVRVRELDYEALRRLYKQWRELSQFYYADYYALTPYSQDPHDWIAWQFHDPERGSGAVQAFRRAESPVALARLKLHDLDPEATYTLTVFDTPGTREATGRQLAAEGLEISLPDKPTAAVVVYQRKK